ncbi:MAG: M12 family metallo-peptidase, partial [Planctomycetota bacterium]
MLMKRMAASVVAGAVCFGSAGLAQAQRDILDAAAPFEVVQSPIKIDTREHVSPFSTPLAVSRQSLEGLEQFEQVTMVGFPISDGELVDLDLRRVRVFDTRAEFVSGNNPAQSAAELGRENRTLIYHGEVAGAPGSDAYLAITPTGTNGFIRIEGNTHMISSGKHSEAAQPRVFNLTTLPEGVIDWKEFQCSAIDPATMRDLNETEITPERVEEVMERLPLSPNVDAPSTFARGDDGELEDECRIVNVAIELDAEFSSEFGGDDPQQALLDYVETLVGAVSFIYRRNINLEFNIIFTRDWVGQPTDADPWEGLSTVDVLFELRDEWTPTSAPTGLAWQGVHLFSTRNLGGGVAFLRAICNLDIAHAVSADMFATFPTDGDGNPADNNPGNWDVVVTAHEWGHNLGAPHTHGLVPVVDGCGLGSCAGAENGTIMSYCHLCPGGIGNIELNFAERILNEGIRPYVEGGAPCNQVAR